MPNTGRMYLREEGTAASEDSVLVSRRPQAGAVLMAGADGLRGASLLAQFWAATIDFGQTNAALTGPTPDAHLIVPAGWKARIYFIVGSMELVDGDVTTATLVPFLAPATDVSADFSAMVMVDTTSETAVGVPVSSPYIVDASAATAEFFIAVTTNGTSGHALELNVSIYGELVRAEP